jgi:hypothetical protein
MTENGPMTNRAGLALAVATLLFPTLASAESRTFDLAPFDEIEVSSGIKANVTVGGAQSVRVDYDSEDDVQNLEVVVRNGKLLIDLERGFLESLTDWFSDGPDITAYVAVPALTEIGANSGAAVAVDGMSGQFLTVEASSGASLVVEALTGEEVDVGGSSGASIDAAGSCGRLTVEASSGAQLDLGRLQCRDVTVDASSGAGASVFASASIDADASSGAGIEVSGKPDKIDIDTSSGGGIDFDNE